MPVERNPARHDRDSVVRTALTLLDEVGLPDLSMRRLATQLGVQPSALYWHFDSKQELLAAVADRILLRVDAVVAPSGSSTEPVLAVARSIRDALFAYRDGAEVAMSSYALGLGAGCALARLREALEIQGAVDEPDVAASVLLQFVFGHALLVQQRLHADSHGAARQSDDADASAAVETTFDGGVRTFLAGLLLASTDHGVRGG